MRILVHFHLSNNDDNQHVHELHHKAKKMIVVLTLIMCKVKEQASVSVSVYFHLMCTARTEQTYKSKKGLLYACVLSHRNIYSSLSKQQSIVFK